MIDQKTHGNRELNPRSLSVEFLPITALKPYSGNARTHSKKQIRKIAESIRAYGFINPILIDRNNRIIAGHGRVEAAKLLGLETVPTICIEHLTEDQIRAYIIADNRLAEEAGWDKSILAIELQHLIAIPELVGLTGFEMAEIDGIIIGDVVPAKGEPDPADQLPEILNGPPVSKPGDLWLLERHRLLCGSALEGVAYQTLMNGMPAAMIFTDPPYNVRIDGHVGGLGKKIRHREFAMASGEMTKPDFISFLTRTCSLLARYSADGSIHYICMDWRHMSELLEAGQLAYTELKNLCVWVKDNGGMGSLYRSQHELVFVFKNGKAPHHNNVQLGQYGRYRTNVWQYPGVNSFSRKSEEGNLLALHPTVKPVAMVADAILDCSARGDIVLDSYLGSGTTLMAAERTGRLCYGMEFDPLYVDLIVRRWQKHTGGSAVHAVSGKRFDDLAAGAEVGHE